MIKSKSDLKYYIESDLKSQGLYPLSLKNKISKFLCPQIYVFQIKMRKLEYWKNCRYKSILSKLLYSISYKRYEKYGYKLGYSIPINIFGPGLCLCHVGTIVINGKARVGSNARIHVGVNIGNYSKVDDS